MNQLKYNARTGMFEARRKKSSKRFFTAGESANFLGWDVGLVSPDAAIYANLNRMKARCRDLVRNNDYIIHARRLMQSNVIGAEGFRLHGRLRRGNEADRTFNKRVETVWKTSGKLKNAPTVDGTMSRIDMGRLWISTLMVDGEVILLLHPAHRGNKFRFAVQFIDTARLDWMLNKSLPNGNEIRMGVEVDKLGKPIAYYFLNHDPTEYMWGYQSTASTHTRVPAARVLHTFVKEMPGQTRGVPMIASPAVRAHMLHRFEEAVVVGARVGASKVGAYRVDEDYQGEAPGDDGDFEVSQTIDPGTFEQLPRGMSLETFDPSYPPANLEEFEKKLLKGIASGLGVDYVAMANDLEGVNYSSIRAGQLEQRAIYKGLQRFYIEQCEERIFEAWLKIQQVNPDTQLDSRKIDRLLMDESYRFIGRGWTWVDPLKEVKAYGEALSLGLTSRRRIVAETLGEDIEDLDEEILEDKQRVKAMGLEFGNAQETQSSQPEPPEPDDEDEDE